MGLFSRKKDTEGFYTGDAPVSAPGMDGEAPTAYIRPGRVQAGYSDRAAGVATSADAAATWAPSSVPYQSDYPSGSQPAGATVPGMTPFSAGQAPTPPGDTGLDPASVAAVQQALGGSRQAPIAAGSLDPATAARVQQALAGRSARRGRRGCVLLAIPLLGAAVGIGAAIFATVQASSAVDDAISVVDPGVPGNGQQIESAALGEPVSIRTRDGAFDLTVFGAETQIGGGWGYDFPGGSAVLVVDAQIARTDGGTDPVQFIAWNWSVVGDDGDRVTGNIISHFQPSLDGPDLVGGQTVRGYVTFDTDATATILGVADGPSGANLATWQIDAATPQVVDGVIGVPARAELSRPGFTVTVGEPAVLAAGDPGVSGRPGSGQYLVLHVEFAGIDGTDGNLGTVRRAQFVFTPDGAEELTPSFGAVADSFSFVSLDAAEPEMGALAFDTTAASGRLELRNEAGDPIITWRIDAA